MIYFIITAIFVYLFRISFVFWGAGKERKRTDKNAGLQNETGLPFVSVIVPSRNEESNIEECLLALANSNYPMEMYEIIAIDDRSEDKTHEIMSNLKERIHNLRIIQISSDEQKKNIKGKAGALQIGFENSKGAIILMTDADCKVNPNWIKSMINSYSNNNGLTASFTLVKEGSFFADFQAVEWIYLHTMALAGVGWKIPLGCFGNNLSISNDAFQMSGGYKNIEFSVTEDLALMQKINSMRYGISYLSDEDATVITKPCTTVKEFISQHRRWAIGGLKLGWKSAIFVLTSSIMWVAIIASLISLNWIWLLALLFVRIFGDYAIIKPMLSRLNKENLAVMVIPSIFIFMLMELIMPFLVINKRIIWKGQKF